MPPKTHSGRWGRLISRHRFLGPRVSRAGTSHPGHIILGSKKKKKLGQDKSYFNAVTFKSRLMFYKLTVTNTKIGSAFALV